MNIFQNLNLHEQNILYSSQVIAATYLFVGLTRRLLRLKYKKQPILQLYQLELVSSFALGGFTLSRLNSKQMKEFDKLQLRQIQKQQQIEKLQQNIKDYKENVQLWTNSQFWH